MGMGMGPESVHIMAAAEETANTQSYTYAYILFPMMRVYWIKFTHYSATLDNECTHNMSTTRGKHKHTTNKHDHRPHIHLLCGMRSHITTRSRGGAVHNTHCQCCTSCSAQLNTHYYSSAQHTLPVLYLVLRSTEHTHYSRAPHSSCVYKTDNN